MTTSGGSSTESLSAPNYGPWRKRSCTNSCFLFVFVAFLACWAALFVNVAKIADPQRIIFPTDSYEQICGRGQLADRPYLFFFNILKCAKFSSALNGCNTTMICVSNCPNHTNSYAKYKNDSEWKLLEWDQKVTVMRNLICDYNIKLDINNLDQIPEHLRLRHCSSIYFKEEPLGGRCIPTSLKRSNDSIMDDSSHPMLDDTNNLIKVEKIRDTTKGLTWFIRAKAISEMVIEDLGHSWKFILVGLGVSMVVSFFWIMLMQVIAGFMVWTSMFAMIILSLLLFHICLQKYMFLRSISVDELDQLETDRLDEIIELDMTRLIRVQLDAILSDKRLWLAFTVVTGLIFFVITITFVFLRKRVRIAISLIREASKSIWHAKFVFIFPIFPYLLQTLVILYFGFTALLITSSGKQVNRYVSGPDVGKICNITDLNNSTATFKCAKMSMISERETMLAHSFNMFGLIWMFFFIKGLCQMIFAGVFARYYWTWDKRKHIPEFLILTSVYTTVRYHLGSVALGSFLLATVNFIRCIVEYIDRKCRQYPNNELARAITCLFRGCFWCLDKFLRFLNTNAYIMVAIYGKPFFTSAKDAFSLLLDNIVRVVVIDQVADYLLFIGKMSVTSLVGFASYSLFNGYILPDKMAPYLPQVTYIWVPVTAIVIGTYLIASSFFSVYDMAVDTIFLCFLKDCKMNDGSSERPYYMSKELMRILNYKNKLIRELNKSQRSK